MRAHAPRDRGSDTSPFVGRDDATDQLARALDRAHAGRFSSVFVSGPGGMGKSRLVGHFLDGRDRRIGTLVSGACLDEGGDLTPFGAVEQVVRQLEDQALSLPDADVPAEHRIRAIVEAIRLAARSKPVVVIVLEDLHWAGDTTLEFIRFAAHSLAREPVLFVGTHRDGRHLHPPLRRVLTSLARDPGCTRLDLGPLDTSAQRQLVAARAGGRVDDEIVDGLVERCGGITLFVEELAQAIGSGGRPAIPQRLRDVFVDRLGELGMGARELLDWAAVCGQQFPHELLALVAELPVPTLEKRIDELLDVGILVVSDHGRGYRFRHALLHETVRDELRPMTLRRLHGGCARVLQRRPDLTPGDALPSADLARRWSVARQAGPALRAYVLATSEATDRGAHGEAARLAAIACEWFRRLPAHEPGEGDFDEVDVLLRAADCADRAGDHHEAIRRGRQALAVAASDDDSRAESWILVIRSSYLAGDIEGAIEAAGGAVADLPADGSPGLRARLLAVSAAFLPTEPSEAGPHLTDEAVRLARRSGDPSALCDALCSHGLALARFGRPREARTALAEAERHATGLSDPRAILRPTVFRMLVMHGSGATHAVCDIGGDGFRRADDLGVARGVGREIRTILADCLVAVGRWDEAEQVVSDGLAWGDDGLAGTLLQLTRADLATLSGRFSQAERDLAAVSERVPRGHFRLSLAASELAWWRGDPMASRDHAADGLARAGLLADPDELGRLTLSLVRASRSVAPVDVGIPPPEDVMDTLSRRAGHPVVDAWLATAAATLAADGTDAVDAWEGARTAWRGLDRPPMVALATWHAGMAHLGVGDRGTAGIRLSEAQAMAEEMGAVPLAVEARAARSTAGLGPAPDSSPPNPRHPAEPSVAGLWPDAADTVPDHFDLTDREGEVLALVARGWTNKRIGEELVISPRTVSTHVSRILDKLGVATRGEAVALRHGSTVGTD